MMEPYFSLANALMHIKKVEEAIFYSNKAAEIDPKNKKGFAYLGKEFNLLNNVDEAMKNYLKAIEIDPDYSQYFDELMQMLK